MPRSYGAFEGGEKGERAYKEIRSVKKRAC